jgi:hypothetical protein
MRVSMGQLGALLVLVSTACAASACGDDDGEFGGNAAGEYTVSITNGANGCNLAPWTVGETATGIPFTIEQDGSSVTGTVMEGPGAWVQFLFGTNQFAGTVSGSDITMELVSKRTLQEGNCVYTINAKVTAETSGDVLTGTIDYTKQTNNNPDCDGIEGCITRQEFNGTRPPQ